ncbi:MAG: hypothetical protein HZA50_03745 [Planctomycetes bacterium]|nr:hypothetical protein [Planctomycetota bacterium]
MENIDFFNGLVGLIPGETPQTNNSIVADEQNTAAKIELLIKKLGDKDLQTRETTSKELRRRIFEAMPALVRYANDSNAEIKMCVKKLIRDYWLDQAIDSYLKSFKLEIAFVFSHNCYSEYPSYYAAGVAYIRLVRARGPTETELDQIKKIENDIETIRNKQIREPEE